MIVALDHGADDFLGALSRCWKTIRAAARGLQRLVSMQKELIPAGLHDLTRLAGMFNRRAFFEKSGDLCKRAAAGEPLCAVMVDIDWLQARRSTMCTAQAVGDEAICAVAHELMMSRVLVGRLGGEEFALLLDQGRSPVAKCGQHLERGCASALSQLPIKAGVETLTLTCSLGVSEWQRNDTIDRMLKRADMALYEAKLAGRNRVVAAEPVDVWRRPTRRPAAPSAPTAKAPDLNRSSPVAVTFGDRRMQLPLMIDEVPNFRCTSRARWRTHPWHGAGIDIVPRCVTRDARQISTRQFVDGAEHIARRLRQCSSTTLIAR